MKNRIKISALLLLLFSTHFGYSQSFEEVEFPDITTTSSASRSANFVDVNGDGWDDIFFSNGLSAGQKNLLYINNQNGTFTTIIDDDIVNELGRSDGVSFADADNDGDLDCFEVTYGFGSNGNKNYYYRNNGDGSFTYEPNSAMGSALTFSEMVTWIDVNNDQFLDLYITNSNGSLQNLYYENQTNGTFLQRTDLSITSENLLSRSIDWIDYDDDGDSDLFVTNENDANNSLFRNDGPNNFTQITNLAIVQDGRSTAGSSWGDVDGSGLPDVFIANWEGQNNQLFFNENNSFSEITNSEIAAGGGNSFGSTFGDVDNDGDLDLLVCNAYFSGQNKNFLYINDGSGGFTQDTTSELANHSGNTFGAAFGDYDNDGWLDVILANTLNETQPNAVFHNTGTGNNWIKILCEGTVSNTSAIGTKLIADANINGSPILQYRWVAASSGYCSQNSYTNHFGLGDATTVEQLTIEWPSGLVESYVNLDANRRYLAIEGQGLSLGTNENQKPSVSIVYPNPASDIMNLKMNDSTGNAVKISLFNVFGKIVMNRAYDEQLNDIAIDISSLKTGQYVLQVNTENSIQIHKIVKK